MLNRTNMLLSPDAAEGGATGTATAGAGESGEQLFEGAGADSEEAGVKEGADTAGGEGATGEATPAVTGLSKDDIAAILQKAGIGEKPAAVEKTESKAVPTVDELEKMFNVFKPSAELIAQLRAEKPEDAMAALVTIRDGMIRQAMTMVEYRVKQLMDNLNNETIAPLQNYVSEAQATSFRSDFFKTYPNLEKYESLVDAVAAKLQQGGYHGPTREAVMKRFAEETQKVVTQLTGATGGNSDGKGDKGAAAGGTRRMSSLSTGGAATAGKGGSGSAKDAKGPPGIEIFD